MCVIFLHRRTEAVLGGLRANKDRLVYFISCAEDELNPPDPLLVFSCRDKWISLSLTPGDLFCCPNSKLDGSKMTPPKGHAKWNFRKAKTWDNGEHRYLLDWVVLKRFRASEIIGKTIEVVINRRFSCAASFCEKMCHKRATMLRSVLYLCHLLYVTCAHSLPDFNRMKLRLVFVCPHQDLSHRREALKLKLVSHLQGFGQIIHPLWVCNISNIKQQMWPVQSSALLYCRRNFFLIIII